MSAPTLSITRRLRATPFTASLEARGVKGYTVYNHMLLPSVIDTVENDCQHLKRAVQIWDVSCERQIAVQGPDANRLMQMLTPRDLSPMQVHQCYYLPVVNNHGGMLNDPVAIKLADDSFWISIADSDLLLWVQGIAVALKMQVEVFEPAVYPLAVQGPLAQQLAERVFGSEIGKLRFFRAGRYRFGDFELLISRSGYSKQGGFEIYVEHPQDVNAYGQALWDELFAQGEDLDVLQGGPNYIERIESGLLSYGSDMTSDNTPDECGLGHFCNEDLFDQCIGGAALRERRQQPDQQRIYSMAIDGEALPLCRQPWSIWLGDTRVGQVTSAVWSPDFATNVAIGMVRQACAQETDLRVETPDGTRGVHLKEKSFN